jgi:hypothetical protein
LQVPNCPFYQFQYFWWLCWCLAHLCCTFAVCFVDKDWRFPVPWDPPVIEEAVAIWGNSRLLQVSTTAEMPQVFFYCWFKYSDLNPLLLSMQRERCKRASDCSICSITLHDIWAV